MKQTLAPGPLAPTWNAQALYDKAERYTQQAQSLDKDGWDYGLWTSLALELLARAALANVHPALLADNDQNAASLMSALAFQPVDSPSPKTIGTVEVLRRLRVLLPSFHQEHESFVKLHTGRRNSELHSGELAFDGIKGSTWQPRYFETCQVLLTSMGLTLDDYVGPDEASAARALMAATADKSAMAVKGDVEAHLRVWTGKEQSEREELGAQAALWANRRTGHRVACPACESQALLFGSPIAAAVRRLEGDEIIDRQEHLPTHFECVACGLKINSLSKLSVVGLSDRFTSTHIYDAAELYGMAEDDVEIEWEDDYNE